MLFSNLEKQFFDLGYYKLISKMKSFGYQTIISSSVKWPESSLWSAEQASVTASISTEGKVKI